MIQNAGLGVGGLLRSRREELGQDTDSVSRQLRIRAIYIRAIEDGRIQDLPGTAYAVGFVRTYADFLGFDGNSVVASFRDELGQRGHPESVSWQIEDKDAGFPIGKLVLVLLVIAAAGYGLWYYLANTQSGTGLIEAVPEYLKKSTGTDKTASPASGATDQAPTSSAGSTTSPAASSTTSPAPAGTATEPQTANGAASPSTAGKAADGATTATQPAGAIAPAAPQTPAAGTVAPGAAPTSQPTVPQGQAAPAGTTAQATTNAPAQATAGQATAGQSTASQATTGQAPASSAAQANNDAAPEVAAAATSSPTRISIRAKLESWVQINDKDGKPVLSRVLRAGETYAVPDQKGLVMSTGNAGGIEVMVDGKTLPSLGSVGLVKRNILLDPDKLTTGTVPVKAPAGKSDPATDGGGGGSPTGD